MEQLPRSCPYPMIGFPFPAEIFFAEGRDSHELPDGPLQPGDPRWAEAGNLGDGSGCIRRRGACQHLGRRGTRGPGHRRCICCGTGGGRRQRRRAPGRAPGRGTGEPQGSHRWPPCRRRPFDVVGGDIANLHRTLAPFGRIMVVGFASGDRRGRGESAYTSQHRRARRRVRLPLTAWPEPKGMERADETCEAGYVNPAIRD